MVGGGRDAFIGAVHRKAIALDGQAEFVAAALSSNPEKAKASGRDLFLAEDRNHGDWRSLLDDELKRPAHERSMAEVERLLAQAAKATPGSTDVALFRAELYATEHGDHVTVHLAVDIDAAHDGNG